MVKAGMSRGDLEAMVERLEEELTQTKEQLSQVVQATGWGPTITGTFYYLSTDGIITAAEVGDNWTDWMHRMVCSNNVFSTEEKAKQMLANKNLYRCLQRYADENDTGEIDWDDLTEAKWYIALDLKTCTLVVHCTYVERLPIVVYFHSETIAQEAKALFMPDLLSHYILDEAYSVPRQNPGCSCNNSTGNPLGNPAGNATKNFKLWEEE